MFRPEITSKPPSRSELTAKNIWQAIVRIQKGRPKVVKPNREMSISSVAEEAGVSRATIHNNHPGLAARIREAGNKTARAQRDKKNADLKKLRTKHATLQKELIHARKLNQHLVSEMASMVVEIERLRSIVGNEKVVAFLSKKS